MVAAASPAGAAVVATAVVVKLTRVVMLAPVVAAVSVVQRMRSSVRSADGWASAHRAALRARLPCLRSARSTGLMPEAALGWITQVQVAALGAALFGMGCSVKIASLAKGSGSVIVVSLLGTLFIGGVTLAGVLWSPRSRTAPQDVDDARRPGRGLVWLTDLCPGLTADGGGAGPERGHRGRRPPCHRAPVLYLPQPHPSFSPRTDQHVPRQTHHQRAAGARRRRRPPRRLRPDPRHPRPRRLARERLAAAVLGRSTAVPDKGDRRFADPAWVAHPFYRRLGQAYLAVERAIG